MLRASNFPLLLLLTLVACAPPPPNLSQMGTLPPGGTIVVRNIRGDIDAFAPARGQPSDQYFVAAYYAPGANAAGIVRRNLVVNARAYVPDVRFLVRGPKDGAMKLSTAAGFINVQDFEGTVNARVDRGDVKMLIPQYANASVGTGNISIIFASTEWPGTLHFSAQNGNVELYVNQNAKARVRMHTDEGTVYSDFPLTGRSQGSSETIDSAINGGGPRSIDVEVRRGSIRMMQLKPQV